MANLGSRTDTGRSCGRQGLDREQMGDGSLRAPVIGGGVDVGKGESLGLRTEALSL